MLLLMVREDVRLFLLHRCAILSLRCAYSGISCTRTLSWLNVVDILVCSVLIFYAHVLCNRWWVE